MILIEKIPANDRAAFEARVGQISQALGIQPDWLMACMWVESRLKPEAAYKVSGKIYAAGLIQFVRSTAKDLGTTPEAIVKMTAAQQLGYVERYLKTYQGRYRSAIDVYLAIHYPKGIGQADDFVLYKKGSTAYRLNANFDTRYGDSDGTVTVKEAKAYFFQNLKGIYSEQSAPATPYQPELSPAQDWTPVPATPRWETWHVLLLLGAILAFGAALFYYLKRPALAGA
jgi:hypothetical protein